MITVNLLYLIPLTLLLCIGKSWGRFSLLFHSDFSPPRTIPADINKVYSVPLNQRISRPILAYLLKDGIRVTKRKHGNISVSPFTIESVDAAVHRQEKGAFDKWKLDGGSLCQLSYNVRYPNRWNSKKAKHNCGTVATSTILDKDLRLYEGMLVAEGLYHYHKDKIPANKRLFIFTVTLPNSESVKNVTNPVLVENPAWYLQFEDAFPSVVQANQPFSFSLKILDITNKTIVSTGLDSTANVNLRVSWEYVTLYHERGKEMFLRSTEARLGGSKALEDSTYHDLVTEKRAESGIVRFTDVRILDTHSTLRLNATLTQARCDWMRTPNLYRDYRSLYLVNDSTGSSYYRYKLTWPIDPSVILSMRFKVTAQSASSLVLLTPLEEIPTKIGANCPIEMELEIRDETGRRIFSGPDSNLVVKLKTTRQNACISNDAPVAMKEGRLLFVGSLCSLIGRIQLYLQVKTTSKRFLRTRKTNSLVISDDIFIGHFDNFYTDERGSAVGATESAFVKYAVRDIKNGVYSGLLKYRKLYLKSFDTKGNTRRAYTLFSEMVKNGKKNPNEMVRAVIGMGGNAFTRELRSLIYESKIVTVATKEDSVEFESTEYPYFNRLCWNSEQVLTNLLSAFQARKWNKITVVRDYGEEMPERFEVLSKDFGITVVKEILLFEMPKKNSDVEMFYKKEMMAIKLTGIRIILFLIRKPMIYSVLRNAIRYKVTCNEGYQWVTYGQYVNEFPWENEHPLCRKEPFCTVAFKGMHGFLPGYNVSGLDTDKWLRLLIPHFVTDSSRQKEKMMYPGQDAALYGLAYDATIVLAKALTSLIWKKRTFTASQITEEIQAIKLTGLTGRIQFDGAKRRQEYVGFLVTVNPMPVKVDTPKSRVAIFGRYFMNVTEYEEIQMEAYYPLDKKLKLAPVVIAKSTHINKVLILSTTGMISSETFWQIPNPQSKGKIQQTHLTEDSVSPYYCVRGCGGRKISKDVYENGNCSGVNQCKCIEGFTGLKCEEIYCTCSADKCYVVDDCVCDMEFCSEFVCKSKCVHGVCTRPNVCTCNSGWIGHTCNMSLPALIAFAVITLFLALAVIAYVLRYVIRKTAKTLALQRMDCILKWDEVSDVKPHPLNFLFVARDLDQDLDMEVVYWRDQMCFVKRFDITSVKETDETVLNDLVLMITLKHANVVTFYGACLTAPNVCLLLEVCPKGSLYDLLANQAVVLDYDFRFSILKDICHGMIHLHDSEIISHGRLKSSNILIDDKWTCKITDFGCQSLRYNTSKLDIPEAIEATEKEKVNDSDNKAIATTDANTSANTNRNMNANTDTNINANDPPEPSPSPSTQHAPQQSNKTPSPQRGPQEPRKSPSSQHAPKKSRRSLQPQQEPQEPTKSPSSQLAPKKSRKSLTPHQEPQEPTKSPSSQLDPRKSPSSQLEPGKSPSSQLEPGKSPSSQLEPGKSPSSQLEPGKSPSSQLEPRKSPSSQLEPRKSPSSQLDPQREPQEPKKSPSSQNVPHQPKTPRRPSSVSTDSKALPVPGTSRRSPIQEYSRRSLVPDHSRRSLVPDDARTPGLEHPRKSLVPDHKKSLVPDIPRKSLVPEVSKKAGIPEEIYETENKEKLSDLYWTSPELLRVAGESLDKVRKGTRTGDVYSFAIIMVEVFTREEPYTPERLLLDPSQIIRLLKNKTDVGNLAARKILANAGFKNYDDAVFRPFFTPCLAVDEELVDKPIGNLIEEAWDEDPKKRPSFRSLLSSLKGIYPVNRGVISMLEKYSINLEDVLAERTKLLLEEKEKKLKVLGELVPVPTLQQLKCGRVLEPETFLSVTILVCDIIGFQHLVKDSTPQQLVTFLNDLHTTFDKIVEKYDVFKLQTTGDKYMVVSGLPIHIANHYEQIATMALDMLCSMVSFKIRFKPNKILEIKIGINTGPVVAGAIGQKVPKYSIFGEGVTIAQEMHHSSKAFKIHLSHTTAELLLSIKMSSYNVERKSKDSKGMGGFWLIGKDNYEKVIPDFDSLLAKTKDSNTII